MKVLKFGGTSVGSPERMKNVANIICDGNRKIVVLSAVSGTTNKLVEISNLAEKKQKNDAFREIENLEKRYTVFLDELYKISEYKKQANDILITIFDTLKSLVDSPFTVRTEKRILAQGEIISTNLFYLHLIENKVNAVLVSALNFMRIGKDDEPDYFYIKENLKREIKAFPEAEIIVTQGFITKNVYGEIDNLQRGGSDYSASLIGAAIKADEIQIWTDIDGFHNNDPRYVKNTSAIRELSFDEAAELAYFGAKILHPASVLPAKLQDIPVLLKNTLQPEALGTLITRNETGDGIKAVAAKDGITAIKINSARMLLAHGFLRKVFETFEKYETSIDMITTSEISVSVTIDNIKNLQSIENELEKYSNITVEHDQTIICVVGNFIAEKTGVALKVFEALGNIPLRMISYGGSKHNISLLINTKDKQEALELLSKHLFSE